MDHHSPPSPVLPRFNPLHNSSLHIKHQINSIAVDSTGSFVALGGKNNIHVLNLSQTDLNEKNPSTLSATQPEKWDTVAVEWNGHEQRKNWIASSSNRNTLIWQVAEDQLSLQGILQSHTRAVADISWSLFDSNILATCSADTYINLWDIRDPKKGIKMKSFCGWTSGATQVKWNRKNQMTLASAHNGEVRIWDIRKVTSPITFITAHMAKIFGLDWSYTSENELLTCSEDKQLKLWDITIPRIPKGTLNAGAPLMKAKFSPFGTGAITMAQRGDYSLRFWSLEHFERENNCVHQFIGHVDILNSFDWRICDVGNKKEYQLVSWSKDQHLRFWSIPKDLKDEFEKPTAKRSPLHNMKNVSSLDQLSEQYQVKDLSQELALLKKRKPSSIEIEQMNLLERTIVVSVIGKQSLKLKIIFPQLYPNGASPSLQLINTENSLISTHTKAKLVEAFNTTAADHVESNNPCLIPCLSQLASLLKDTTVEDEVDSDNELTSPILKIQNTLNTPNTQNDTNVPAPRTSGAIFGCGDKLISFNSLKYRSTNVPNYKEFKKFRTGKLAPSGPQFSISSYFYSKTDFTSSNESPFEYQSSGTLIDAKMKIHDASAFTFLNFNLSRDYKLNGTFEQICLHNAQVAQREGRKDLVQIWKLLSISLNENVYRLYQPMLSAFGKSWDHHPLGKNVLTRMYILKNFISIFSSSSSPQNQSPFLFLLLKSLSHYLKVKDLPTLAMISCLLLQPKDISAKTSSKNKLTSKIKFKDFESKFSLGRDRNEQGVIPSLLDPQFKAEAFIYAYAEILWRWNLFEQRCEILKFLKTEPVSPGVTSWTSECQKCTRQVKSSYVCPFCKDFSFYCSLCHLPVKSTGSFCLQCAHGGHTTCLQNWFVDLNETFCPSGCSCRCCLFEE